jgi:hypothetical protein
MQGRIAFVLIIAAFCAGALADRAYAWWMASDDVPAYAGTPRTSGNMPATGSFDMQNCMDGAVRQGMTRDQATHACQQIVN